MEQVLQVEQLPSRRVTAFVLIGLIFFSMIGGQSVQAEAPSVSAEAALLMDVETGRILFEKNSEAKLRIASITKIMTAILAIEQGDVEEKVAATRNAVGVEGSSIYLRLGEKLTLEDLLYGMMLRSGNDAAMAIAEHIGGSKEGFVFLMNQKAAELGMTSTMFNNPHGLDDHEQHYSTAKDMAVLSAYALKNPTFSTIVSTKKKTAPAEGTHRERIWYNKNKLLVIYPYADGVKTGYTLRAKRTLVSSATKDGHQLVAVTLNAPNDWEDHISMFEYGFRHYNQVTLIQAGERLEDKQLKREDGYFSAISTRMYPLTEQERVQTEIRLDPIFSNGKITKQEIPSPAGYIQFYLENQQIAQVPLQFTLDNKQHSLSIWNRFLSIFKKAVGARIHD